jgi:undecaprenyl diphosphate synthase
MFPKSAGIPRHVAIIMDGNGRWAQARGLPRAEGHTRGAEAVRETVRTSRARGVKFLTLYAFSVANWDRPRSEVRALMQLLAHFADREKVELREKGIRLNVIGDVEELPTAPRRAIESAMEHTAEGNEMVLSLALSYGGRQDILSAARALAVKVRAGVLLPEDIDEKALAAEMSTHALPPVDLLIRTGGESRVSDFLLFEAAYAELLFLPVMWPEFREAHFASALSYFAHRERRFGLTPSQISPGGISASGNSSGNGFDPHDSTTQVAAEHAAV